MEQQLFLNLYLNEFQDCAFYLIHKDSLKQFLDSLSTSSRAYEVDMSKFLQSLSISSFQSLQHLEMSDFKCFIEPITRKPLTGILGGTPL